ncbi:MAG: hypothetical protein HYR56_24445 [Acidobacteria bacterium]|nr:hypothetical protein [Acidobacteriota bacterium]MBI3426409.1 hypothetical protein [Acidobacteriota bacterium]
MLQKIFPLTFPFYLLLFFSTTALPQSDPPKYEIGVHATSVQPAQAPSRTIGGGLRVTYNFNSMLALEGEANLFNHAGIGGYMRGQGLGGLKAGARFSKFGVFGKIRPGIVRNKFGEYTKAPCFGINPPPNSTLPRCRYEILTRHDFALDMGGVLEFYPTRRWVIRFDASDLVSRRRLPDFTVDTTSLPISVTIAPAPDVVVVRHHLQINAGVGIRF